jgi:hypothetical protein
MYLHAIDSNYLVDIYMGEQELNKFGITIDYEENTP